MLLKSVLQKELFEFVICTQDVCFWLLDFSPKSLFAGVCKADCVRHSGDLPDHPDWRLCQSRYRALLKLLLVLGPGGWIRKSGVVPNQTLTASYLKLNVNSLSTQYRWPVVIHLRNATESRPIFYRISCDLVVRKWAKHDRKLVVDYKWITVSVLF